jgi:inner membrane protein
MVVVVLAVQLLLDRLDVGTQFFGFGFVDWIGHLATGVVLIAALRPSAPTAAGILLGSVVLDLDHLPLELLGSDVLTGDAPRPYTHSLLSLLVVVALAAVTRRRLLAGLAIGIAGHLARDIGGGELVLLWPLTDSSYRLPFAVYVLALVLLALTAARAAARPTARRTPLR